MMRLILIAFSIMLIFTAYAGAQDDTADSKPDRRVAITFDDLPINSRSFRDTESWQRMTADLLDGITSDSIPAIGFVNEDKLYNEWDELDPDRVALLENWLKAGLELGNHTYSHPDLHRTTLNLFKQDVLRGEEVTRPLMESRGMTIRYFRHPFLHTGRDLETKEGLEAFLAEYGYTVAPVTVDNSEWIFALAYDLAAAEEDDSTTARVAEAYITYMETKFAYFEQQSVALFGYEIPQVLLLHANLLNADHFEMLTAMLIGRGYRFVSLDTALEDPAYDSEDTYTGRGGITWIHRWAITQGKKREFFEGEPTTPEFVMEYAGVDSE